MLNILLSIAAFTVAIAILVTIHEFGHFWVARKCGVKVLRFSVGFGKPLWKHTSKIDGTEYVIAMIPLGGYVSMLGEADNTKDQINDENRNQAYNEKHVTQRMAITLAGPIANFIFAIFAFWVLYLVGMPGVKPWVNEVQKDSYAWKAGVRAGDYITEIDGEKAQTWGMVRYRILTALVRQDSFTLKWLSKDKVEKTQVLNFSGSQYNLGPKSTPPLVKAGFYPGIPSTVGILSKDGPAKKAGIKIGDKIVSIDGVTINMFQDIPKIINKKADRPVTIEVSRDGNRLTFDVTPDKYTRKPINAAFIGTMPGKETKSSTPVSPVNSKQQANILPGDQILKINGKPLSNYYDMRDRIQKIDGLEISRFSHLPSLILQKAGTVVEVEVRRKGELLTFKFTPKVRTISFKTIGRVGIGPSRSTTKESYGLMKALGVGGWKTWDMSLLTVQVFAKMITGQASTKNISGPFTIGDVAGKAVKRGLDWYLYILAIISLSLGVINLMPIPVLDGGHFMFQVIEVITRRPVSDTTRMVGTLIGLGLILMLMTLAFYNDFQRFFGG